MSDYLPVILAACQADSALVAAATGGVYLHRNLKGEKLTPQLNATAFDASGFLKPLLIIKGRASLPFGYRDASDQSQGMRQVIEFWAYNDTSAGYTVVQTIQNRVYALFQQKVLTGGGWMARQLRLEDKDLNFNRSVFIRCDYTLVGS